MQEGIEYLEKNRPDLAEQCKAVAKETPENGAGDAPKATKNGDSPAKLPRDNTMVTTAEVRTLFITLYLNKVITTNQNNTYFLKE